MNILNNFILVSIYWSRYVKVIMFFSFLKYLNYRFLLFVNVYCFFSFVKFLLRFFLELGEFICRFVLIVYELYLEFSVILEVFVFVVDSIGDYFFYSIYLFI